MKSIGLSRDRGSGDYTVRAPESASEWLALYDLRWRMLRAPWGQPPGSERDELDCEACHRVAVTSSGQVIGAGRLHRRREGKRQGKGRGAGVGQVRYMAVEETWRGRGVGSAILGALEEEAGRWGLEQLILQAREAVVGFYARHGYRDVGEGPVLFGEIRHRTMEKDLGGSRRAHGVGGGARGGAGRGRGRGRGGERGVRARG